MSFLRNPHKGWENEHLALFLLSRISFVSNPVTVADDVGSDFFCTLFEVGERDTLFPRSSFAIQVKSSKDRIDPTGKIKYFEKLELPFFVGVIDQKHLRLSIYSGEYLPIFFSHYGIPQDLKLSLEDTPVTFENYCEVRPEGKYILRMPHLLDLEAQEDKDAIVDKGRCLIDSVSECFKTSRLDTIVNTSSTLEMTGLQSLRGPALHKPSGTISTTGLQKPFATSSGCTSLVRNNFRSPSTERTSGPTSI